MVTPVEHNGRQVAALVHDASLDEDPELLEAACAATAVALENQQLLAEADTRLEELRASRERIVAAGDAERRRLERNLHDGAQQRLVAIALQLRLLQNRVGDDPSAAQLVTSASDELAESLAELRELARGLHPAVLEHGLPAALGALASRSTVATSVSCELRERLPEQIELAAYFVASEALANVGKYSHARHVTVRLWRERRAREHRDRRRRDRRRRRGARLRPARARGPRRGARRQPQGREPDRRGHRGDRGAAVRVVIADDNLLVRKGIAALLEESGIEVTAQADTAEELLAAVAEHEPDVAIVDVRMPPTQTDEGLQAAHAIRERHPATAIVVLSQHVEYGIAVRVLAERPERLGYLLKDRVTDPGDFVRTLARVAGGGTALDPEVVARLLAPDGGDGPLSALSPRELEVLQLVGEGLSNPAIGERLGITLRSAEKHVSSVFARLGLPDTGNENRRVLAVLHLLRG